MENVRPRKGTMPVALPNGNHLQVVVVTVCLEKENSEQIIDAVEQMPWLVDISHLDTYSSASRRPAFGPQMKAADAGVAFIDFAQNSDQAIDCAQYLAHTFGSKLVIVAVGDDEHPDLILGAMRAGCSEYLSSPLGKAPLARTLHRFNETWSKESRRFVEGGSVLAFLGAKGGVGTTTLALHLAYYLTVLHRKRVLFVDSQPELGHACVYLGLDGRQFTFAEVVRNVNRLDSALLKGFVAKHPSGLAVLSSSDDSAGVKHLDVSAVAKTLEFLRSEYDYVVVDCDRFSETTRMVVEAASRIYLVATPEIAAIRDLSRHVDRILRKGEAQDRLHVVLNRFASYSGLNQDQIEKALRLPVHIRIPNNYPLLVKAGNLAQPVEPSSKTDIGQEMKRWANSLVQLSQPEGEEGEKRSPHFWQFLRRSEKAVSAGATP